MSTRNPLYPESTLCTSAQHITAINVAPFDPAKHIAASNYPFFTRFLIVSYESIKKEQHPYDVVKQCVTSLSNRVKNALNMLEDRVALSADNKHFIASYFIDFFNFLERQEITIQETFLPYLEWIAYYITSLNLANYLFLRSTNSAIYQYLSHSRLRGIFSRGNTLSALNLREKNTLTQNISTLIHNIIEKLEDPTPVHAEFSATDNLFPELLSKFLSECYQSMAHTEQSPTETLQKKLGCLSENLATFLHMRENESERTVTKYYYRSSAPTLLNNLYKYLATQDIKIQEEALAYLEKLTYHVTSTNLTDYIQLRRKESLLQVLRRRVSHLLIDDSDPVISSKCSPEQLSKNQEKHKKQKNQLNNDLPLLLKTITHHFSKIKSHSEANHEMPMPTFNAASVIPLPIPQPQAGQPTEATHLAQRFFSPVPENALKRSMSSSPLEEPDAKRMMPDETNLDIDYPSDFFPLTA